MPPSPPSPDSPLRVLVLAGGLSHERDVSLRSGRRVGECLRAEGCSVLMSDADAGLLGTIRDEGVDVVFPVLHGAAGEDGGVKEVLGLLGVPYVGATPDSCRLAWDKPVARAVAATAGLDVPDGVALAHATFRELGAAKVLDAVLQHLGLPVVVKPTRGGSALGVTVVRSAEALPGAMVSAFAYGDTALVERYVAGTEVAVSVLDLGDGPQPLPPVEIVPDGGLYDFEARYTAGRTEFFTPARLSEVAARLALQAAVTAHRCLGMRHLSRTDLVVDDSGDRPRVWFLEVNSAPGMTETSLLPQSVAAAERSLGEVYLALARAAAAEPVDAAGR